MENLWDWIQTSGLKIFLIIAVAFLFERFSSLIAARLVKSAMNPDKYASPREERLREKTVAGLVSAVIKIAVAAIALMVILSELDIDIGPLIAGAGVAGLAIGFGAQSLIKDFIAGVFIVLENQYRVGDIVKLNGVGGQVQKITTRITVLRDLDGNVHYFPNGSIETATNMSMEFAKINMDIGVSYSSDIDKVKTVVNQVGEDLSNDEEWSSYIIKAPYFARVKDFADSAILIKIFGKVQPAKQWAVEGELRKRLKKAFDKNDIEIPFHQVVVHQPKKKSAKG